MYFGAAYYPEHWPREWWETSAKLMKEAHFNVVRLAEFAWAKLEPNEGEYDFSWLDEAIEVLAREGIKVIMSTPTATPPKWLLDKYPEIYPRDAYGRVKGFGSRRNYCFNSKDYHRETKRIVSIISGYFKDNPNVIAWQIDNEFGCHGDTYCFCANCLEEFKGWVRKKYQSIDKLKQAWGTVFWSQTYKNWDELIFPAYTACEQLNQRTFAHNPGLLLDYSRFCSDSVIAYQKLQIEELKASGCTLPMTHNLMGHFSDIDYFQLGKDLDFVSWDNYVTDQWNRSDYKSKSMAHDLMRGIKEKNYWMMEQQSGPCGWSAFGDTPMPGQLRLWTFQSIAHGADAIVYFRWRACTFGTEEYWYGILDHDGIPRRRYKEIQQTGKELERLSDLLVDSEVIAEVAIVKSYDNLWSHRHQTHNHHFDYNNLLIDYYKGLITNNINTDVVSVSTDLTRYKIVFMPAFNLVNEEIRKRVEAYVIEGGTLILTFRSGTRNWDNSMTTETLPGYFKNLAGVEVYEFDSLNYGRTVKIQGDMGEGKAALWCDILKPEGAKTIAFYQEAYYRGEAAITVNTYGKGNVYYVGCDIDEELTKKLVREITRSAGVLPVFDWTIEGVEVVKKQKDLKEFFILLNHNDHPVNIDFKNTYSELISEKEVKTGLTLEAFGVAILE